MNFYKDQGNEQLLFYVVKELEKKVHVRLFMHNGAPFII